MQSTVWCHVRSKKKSLRYIVTIDASKVLHNFHSLMAINKNSHKYMYFDHKNFAVKVSVIQTFLIFYAQECYDGSPTCKSIYWKKAKVKFIGKECTSRLIIRLFFNINLNRWLSTVLFHKSECRHNNILPPKIRHWSLFH